MKYDQRKATVISFSEDNCMITSKKCKLHEITLSDDKESIFYMRTDFRGRRRYGCDCYRGHKDFIVIVEGHLDVQLKPVNTDPFYKYKYHPSMEAVQKEHAALAEWITTNRPFIILDTRTKQSFDLSVARLNLNLND